MQDGISVDGEILADEDGTLQAGPAIASEPAGEASVVLSDENDGTAYAGPYMLPTPPAPPPRPVAKYDVRKEVASDELRESGGNLAMERIKPVYKDDGTFLKFSQHTARLYRQASVPMTEDAAYRVLNASYMAAKTGKDLREVLDYLDAYSSAYAKVHFSKPEASQKELYHLIRGQIGEEDARRAAAEKVGLKERWQDAGNYISRVGDVGMGYYDVTVGAGLDTLQTLADTPTNLVDFGTTVAQQTQMGRDTLGPTLKGAATETGKAALESAEEFGDKLVEGDERTWGQGTMMLLTAPSPNKFRGLVNTGGKLARDVERVVTEVPLTPKKGRDAVVNRGVEVEKPQQPHTPEIGEPGVNEQLDTRLKERGGHQFDDALDEKYRQAAKIKPELDRIAGEIADSLGGEVHTAPLKGRKRASDKIAADYSGDARKIKDLARVTIVSENPQAVVREIQRRFKVEPKRNNFGKATQDGYQDALFNVPIEGGSAEIQVHHPALLKAKERTHPLYQQMQEIRRAAMREGRDLTSEEARKLDDLIKEQKEIYDSVSMDRPR